MEYDDCNHLIVANYYLWNINLLDLDILSAHLSSVLLPAGMWFDIYMPQTSVEVINGQMVVLQASYKVVGFNDPKDSTVIWNFLSDNPQLVRTKSDLNSRLLWSKNVNMLAELLSSSAMKT